MIYDPEVETRPVDAQFALDRDSYAKQVAYLLENSTFYKAKLAEAGIENAADAGGLDDIAKLPFTEKDPGRCAAVRRPPGLRARVASARVLDERHDGCAVLPRTHEPRHRRLCH